MMLQEKVQVLWNENVCGTYFRIGLTCRKGFADAGPGQFVMLNVSSRFAPLLRRPFSIHRLVKKEGRLIGIEVLYNVVGNGTTKLSRLKAGEAIDLLGPLGKGFTVPEGIEKIFLVAGGIGVAPIVFLAQCLTEKGFKASNCHVFFGGRSETDLLCREEFTSLDMPISTTTEDGTSGEKGFVTRPLETLIAKNAPDIIYACGPSGMLRAVAEIAKSRKLRCQVSVETMMACGMGACLGCAVKKEEKAPGYLHACIDGPVFDAAVLEL